MYYADHFNKSARNANMNLQLIALILCTVIYSVNCKTKVCLNDKYRPQLHFSPAINWSNDPNGMVYYKGEYHLHFQHHPFSNLWGPMHWGHAVSQDMVNWEEIEIALYPDELGAIWSGSAVVDSRNTSGLQASLDEDVIVAIFTHAGGSQQQSLAYSNDRARTYTKFPGNPVIPNHGFPDFRDPKVIEYNGKWIMVLAVGHNIIFYESTDLKSWRELSRFGEDPPQGAHGGVWECSDLVPFEFDGDTVWVLLVSLFNNGFSNIQYFVGDFDGVTFRNFYSGDTILLMESGPDDYAGVTFFDEPRGRKVLMGWMNNQAYLEALPTVAWRGQMTFPRVLQVKHVEGKIRLASYPIEEIANLRNSEQLYLPPVIGIISSGSFALLTSGAHFQTSLMEIDMVLQFEGFVSFDICFYNGLGQQLCFGYEHANRQFFLDRTLSGNVGFHGAFPRRELARRESSSKTISLKIILDVSSIEIFADGGLNVYTSLFFPDEPYTLAHVHRAQSRNLFFKSRVSPYKD